MLSKFQGSVEIEVIFAFLAIFSAYEPTFSLCTDLNTNEQLYVPQSEFTFTNWQRFVDIPAVCQRQLYGQTRNFSTEKIE